MILSKSWNFHANFVAGSKVVYFFLGLPECHNSVCLSVLLVLVYSGYNKGRDGGISPLKKYQFCNIFSKRFQTLILIIFISSRVSKHFAKSVFVNRISWTTAAGAAKANPITKHHRYVIFRFNNSSTAFNSPLLDNGPQKGGLDPSLVPFSLQYILSS